MRTFTWKLSLLMLSCQKWGWTLYSNISYQIFSLLYSLPVLPTPWSFISHVPKFPVPCSIPTLPLPHLTWHSAASLWAAHTHFHDAFYSQLLPHLYLWSNFSLVLHSYLFSFTFLVSLWNHPDSKPRGGYIRDISHLCCASLTRKDLVEPTVPHQKEWQVVGTF